MKTLKIWSLVAMLFMGLTACNGGNDDVPPAAGIEKIVNEWVLATWNGTDAPFTVYIDFNEDDTYEMYQLIYGDFFVKYSGTYKISGDTLTGTYEDGSLWKSEYKVALTNEGKVLTLDSQEEVSIRSVYDATVIPEDVKLEASTTRAIDVEPFL